ncbi:Tol-Pal system protein TolB [Bienertia sinuspersici]
MGDNGEQTRGSLAFFATYRPPVPFDIYASKSAPTSVKDEIRLSDAYSYNYNGQVIPSSALKTILNHLRSSNKTHQGSEADVDAGRLTGLIFVSERTNNLETLHIALLLQEENEEEKMKVEVFNFADVYNTFKGVRMEDSGCIAGDYLIYVSTKEAAPKPHQPWTAVYRTRQADLSPAVSPDGKRIAVASFQRKGGWDGEIEDLQTSIFVMNVERPYNRKLVLSDGGWPTWGSNNVLFFHRNIEKVAMVKRWGVFRADLRVGPTSIARVTDEKITAMTPVAIDESKVVVATMRERFTFDVEERKEVQYRHIEMFTFDENKPSFESIEITRKIRPKADHFNPFVIDGINGVKRIGYHRCNIEKANAYNVVEKEFYKLQSPISNIEVFRVSGVFPTISTCGRKLAFVDNEFKAVWIADSTGLYMVYEANESDRLFSPVWNKGKDILYVCEGPAFSKDKSVVILAIINVTRNGYKNLFIMEDAELGEFDGGEITRLTQGEWVDTHCQWSPDTKDWIVFSSNRANPKASKKDDLPDPGYFGVYLMNADNKDVAIKVIDSGRLTLSKEIFPGHVNHPVFSPDGKSLVVTADLAAVSCDPISLPLFVHSVRPYGDVFVVDIDPYEIEKNKDLTKFTRITHSRYENATATWTLPSGNDLKKAWRVDVIGNDETDNYQPACPYVHKNGDQFAESIHMTGHLCIPNRCC